MKKKVKKSNIIEVKETFQMTSGVQKKLDKQLHIEKILDSDSEYNEKKKPKKAPKKKRN